MIVLNETTNRLCRYVDLEMFAGMVRVKMVDLKDGMPTVAVMEKVKPYRGNVIDLHA